MKKIYTRLFLITHGLCLITTYSFSQDIVWQNTIGGNNWDDLFSIIQTTDGGYICGGASNSNISGDKTENSNGGSDYWIVKLDPSGNIQWQNTIGGNSTDPLREIQQTADGGYICGGYSASNISGDKSENNWDVTQVTFDYWVVKLNSTGSLQWQNTIGGIDSDWLNSISQTTDGGYICGGSSGSNISGDKTENCLGGPDYWIVKLDVSGNLEWQNTIGGSIQDYFTSISQTSDGGYICSGYSYSNISGDKTENNIDPSLSTPDYWVVKLDGLGNLQWQNTIGGNNEDWLNSIVQTLDGGYVCGGWSASNISGDKTENNSGSMDYWVIKLDEFGNIQWQNTIGGNGLDWLNSISQTLDGGYICGGLSSSNISGDKTENSLGFEDYWLVKLDTSGNIEWQNTIGGSNSDNLYPLSKTTGGEYVFGGKSWSNISGDKTENNIDTTAFTPDYWVIKINDTTLTTSISSNIQHQNQLSISPNPTSTEFLITNYNFQPGDKITLMDVLGKIIFTKIISAPRSHYSILTTPFPNGIYFLQLKTKEGVVSKKVLVQH